MAPKTPHSLFSSLSLALYLNVALASLPLVDFDRMGKVGLAGSFAGLDLFSNVSSSLSFDPATATLLARSADGALSRVGSTNSGGAIVAGCALDNTFFLAGTFSSIGGTSAANIASYTPSSNAFAALGSGGPNGEIHALFCDTSHKKVWAGGSFSSPSSSVAVWDVASSSWGPPPFGGLAGAQSEVLSITTNASQSSLFFAGSFVTSFGNGSTALNGTNNPNVPFSAGATPFSSSLVPVPLQNAQITTSANSTDPQFNNIENILCPAGADGPGNTWLAQDGNKAVITVRKFSFLSAGGIRLGNTFVNGRSTTGFSVITIPDNAVQTMQYTDPQTGENRTCTDPCPLVTDPSIPYQDFLFNNIPDVTGFQLTLSEWNGVGPGLHLLQLLSTGAFASAIDADNGDSCFAPNPSNVSRTGTWVEKDANTNIPATIQAVLVSEVDVGTPSAQGPTFTWFPYVSASGQYDMNLLVPGCTNFQDCDLRTSVKVTVFPGNGLPPFVSTVSQQNTADAVVSIYKGPVVPTSPTFVATVTMALADQPAGSGQNGKYELVADRVQMVLTSPNITANGTAGSLNGTAGAQRGFGFFEWPLTSTTSVNATSVLSNSTETALDSVGFDFTTALSSASTSSISAVAHHPAGSIFLGGTFNLSSGPASGASNIVMFKNGGLSALPNGGLNGPVTSLVIDGDKVFVGGAFTDTVAASTQGKLRGVAMYDVQQNQWSPLLGGVDGSVASLGLSENQLLVAGNFTHLLAASAGGITESAQGFAAWNVNNGTWVNSGGFLVGSMTFIGNGTTPSKGQSQTQFVAGSVTASLKFGASGFVMLQNGASDGIPQVAPLSVPLESGVVNASTTTHAKRRGAHHHRSWMPKLSALFRRQATAAVAPLPAASPAIAPAVLGGAFWTNSSSSKEVVVIGGNFSFTSSSGVTSQNIALYDSSTGSITALQGNTANGIVRSLLVQGDQLFVGGTFTVQGTDVNGFAVYDLVKQAWDVTGLQALQGASGASVVVRSITVSPSQTQTLIVAGSFAQAGSQPCRAVCSYNIATKQWSALGNGIQGEASAVSYAGNGLNVVIVAGSIALADSTAANVAQYSLSNGTWSAVGNAQQLPGPVTAMEVDNGNISSVFAAGRSTDGSSSFLWHWDGQTWSSIKSTFASGTDVSQLVMVPLQNTHAANGVIESDRMLMISGALSDQSFGNVSAALFDGQQFIPYIVSTSPSGVPGTVSSLIHSFSQFSFNQHHFLAVGVVILISIAIAAGVVFLLALIGILWTLFSRRDEKAHKYDPAELEDDESGHRPSSLLEHINAATRETILGSMTPSGGAHREAETAGGASASSERDIYAPDDSNYLRAATPSDAIVGTMSGEESSRPAHARYSFDAGGDGELSLSAGQEIEILDDADAAWWYARDTRTGREGVVPAAYVY